MDIRKGIYYQKCHDPDCKAVDFKSEGNYSLWCMHTIIISPMLILLSACHSYKVIRTQKTPPRVEIQVETGVPGRVESVLLEGATYHQPISI